jgi:hydroxymethylpyrimidine pyrophosphatase-like HAD family hydrolase
VSTLRLIATDLDGTFLRPDGTVSATNLAAVRAASERGIVFVVATGRPFRWLDVLDGLAGTHSKVIVSNGAAVFDLAGGCIVQSFPLNGEVALAVADDLRLEVPGMTFALEAASGFGYEPDCPTRQTELPDALCAPLPELLTAIGPVIKLLGFHPGIESDELTTRSRATVADRLYLTHASVNAPYGMIELTAPGVTKASTLEVLCAELGIAADEVVAFGDMPNDVEMLEWAGRGFVVANGHPSLLRRFEAVPPNSSDGVGTTILDLLAAGRPY